MNQPMGQGVPFLTEKRGLRILIDCACQCPRISSSTNHFLCRCKPGWTFSQKVLFLQFISSFWDFRYSDYPCRFTDLGWGGDLLGRGGTLRASAFRMGCSRFPDLFPSGEVHDFQGFLCSGTFSSGQQWGRACGVEERIWAGV